uniref:RNase_Zc3h12a domain-containing protein n=1 Tax=Caenorhabditis tropicalis TaxID=1561998 RepID=A0A1I7ULV4_9PELO
MNVDNYGWESSLSMVANEQTRTARPRHGTVPTLLRPVFMNAVEVGYSYAHCDRDKKLNVRGVTIALWHFICRGHQAIALLPYCFKNYAEKSSRYSELMMLYRLNLIEFTPGYGSEKYTEVNRIMVNRAHETGGCLVARSQMQGITDNKTHLIDVVEQRLLMPTFNGDDIMFPIDGPLGRNGPSLEQTLQCEQGSQDWRSCSEHQLLLSDQRHWLEKLALLVPEKPVWTRMVQIINSGGGSGGHDDDQENEQPPAPSPPLENPFNRPSSAGAISRTPSNTSMNEQYHPLSHHPHHHPPPLPHHQHYQMDPYPHHPSHHLSYPHQFHQQRRRFSSPRNYGPSFYHHPNHHHQTAMQHRNNSTRLIIRYGTSPQRGPPRHDYGGGMGGGRVHFHEQPDIPHRTPKYSATIDSVESTDSTQSGEREESPTPSAEAEQAPEEVDESKKRDELLANLSQIFGYPKSVRVISKFPTISKFAVLVEKCLHEPDQEGDSGEFADVWTPPTEAIDDAIEDLIDFSDDAPLPIAAEQEEEEEGTTRLNVVDLMF